MEFASVSRSIVISIRPEFAELIFSGEKTVELRRVVPKDVPSETEIYIYVSSPVQSIVGKAVINKVEAHPLKKLWNTIGDKSGISLEYFNEYFNGKKIGYGLVLDNVTKFPTPFHLHSLKKHFNFHPPQSYMYTTNDLLNHIR